METSGYGSSKESKFYGSTYYTEHAGVIAVMEIILVIGKEAGSNHGEDILITSNILFVTTPHQDLRQLYVIYMSLTINRSIMV